MKTREMERQIKAAGGALRNARGTHHTYEMPDGRRITIMTGGCHSDADAYLEMRFKKFMAGEPRCREARVR